MLLSIFIIFVHFEINVGLLVRNIYNNVIRKITTDKKKQILKIYTFIK